MTEHIFKKGLEKFNKLERGVFVPDKKLPEMTKTFSLPAEWFIKKDKNENQIEVNWHSYICMNTNRLMTKFAFINKKMGTYLAFTPCNSICETQYYQENRIKLSKKSLASHGRNQFTKDHLFFILKTPNEETTCTLIFDHNKTKTIILEEVD